MTLEHLIQSAAATLGMDDFRYSPGATCELELGNGLQMVIEPSRSEEAVHLYAVVGDVPVIDREKFMETLLKAQLFHREVGEGCCFGLDDEAEEIILNRKVSTAELGEDQFLAILNEFANWASFWKTRLESPESTGSAGADAIESSSFIRA
jgi:hypothetical protein